MSIEPTQAQAVPAAKVAKVPAKAPKTVKAPIVANDVDVEVVGTRSDRWALVKAINVDPKIFRENDDADKDSKAGAVFGAILRNNTDEDQDAYLVPLADNTTSLDRGSIARQASNMEARQRVTVKPGEEIALTYGGLFLTLGTDQSNGFMADGAEDVTLKLKSRMSTGKRGASAKAQAEEAVRKPYGGASISMSFVDKNTNKTIRVADLNATPAVTEDQEGNRALVLEARGADMFQPLTVVAPKSRNAGKGKSDAKAKVGKNDSLLYAMAQNLTKGLK